MSQEKPTRKTESRFRKGRNATLALAVAGAAAYTEVQHPGLRAATALSLWAASGFEMFRFVASPDSSRKRRIMNRVGKGVGALMFYSASMNTAEAVTLVTDERNPVVTTGLIGMRSFLTEEEVDLPDSTAEHYSFAAADLSLAALELGTGIWAWHPKDENTALNLENTEPS